MTNDTPVQAEDVIPVRSRISWAAILAGSLLALAVWTLLVLLGSAIGLSIHDNVTGRSLAIGAVVWAILITAGSLFLGGFVASQMTTGENKLEGALYGILVWAVMSGVLMYLAAQGFKAGFSGMVAMANTGNNAAAANGLTWVDMARQSGVPENEIARMTAAVPDATARAREAANDPNRVEDTATRAAWYSFLGTLIAMAAAAVGGYVGSGPTLRLFTMRVQQPVAFERRDTFVRT
jgi:hypothetical protein